MLLFKDELQITKSQLQVATEELKKSKKHAEAVPNLMRQLEKMNRSEQSKEQRVRALEAEVQSAKVHQQELQQTRSQLEAATEELNRSKQNADALPTLKQKLEQLQDSEARSRERVLILEDELRFSKEQVEDALSKLKFAEQESRTRARRRPAASEEETRTRRHEDEAFELGVQCVAEANRALGGRGDNAHPIFGQLLHDFGHKKLYCADPLTLWSGTLVWDKQRAFRPQRAELIAKAKERSAALGWPGTITIVEAVRAATAETGALETGAGNEAEGGASDVSPAAVVDGQHRLGAAHLLSQKGKLLGPLGNIFAEVYPSMSESAVKELYTEINKAEPVSLIDLPDVGASAAENVILTEAAEKLANAYPSMFKPSQNCRPPHLNVDLLRNEMHKAGVLERHSIGSSDELLKWLEEVNKQLAGLNGEEWKGKLSLRVKSEDAAVKALRKAADNKFFLGLGFGWLEGGVPVKEPVR